MKFLLFLASSSAAVAFAVWTYRKRELPVAGRWGLSVVRSAALVLILLLLFDPRLPGTGPTGMSRWVLVDASASMVVGPSGASPWNRAATRARTLQTEGTRVLRARGSGSSPTQVANAITVRVFPGSFIP